MLNLKINNLEKKPTTPLFHPYLCIRNHTSINNSFKIQHSNFKITTPRDRGLPRKSHSRNH